MNRPSVYFLPGWGFSTHVWDSVVDRVKAFCTPQVIDIWQLFATQESDEQKAIKAIIKDLKRQTEADALWVCWSMSSLLAMEMKQCFPQHIDKVLILCGSPKFVTDEDWQYGIQAGEFNHFKAQFEQAPAVAIKQFSRWVGAGDRWQRENRSILHSSLLKVEQWESELMQGLQFMQNLDYRQHIRQQGRDYYFLSAGEDVLLNSDEIACLQEYMPAQIEVLSGSGHAVLLSQQERVTEKIKELLGKVNE